MRVIKLVLKIIIGLVILQMIYLLLAETKEIGRMGDHAQGNYVLDTNRNTILSAPFVFGFRLYLYDIERGKSYLIKNLKLPLQDWGLEMCFTGEKILAYGGAGMGNPPSDILLLSLYGKSRKILQDSSVYGMMTLTEDEVYYTIGGISTSEKWHDTVTKMYLATGKKEVLLQRGKYAFESFYLYRNNLLAVDDSENKLIVKNLLIFDYDGKLIKKKYLL